MKKIEAMAARLDKNLGDRVNVPGRQLKPMIEVVRAAEGVRDHSKMSLKENGEVVYIVKVAEMVDLIKAIEVLEKV